MSGKVLKSSLFSSGAQIINKSLGLISTLILARMLTPEDFALIAIISIVLYFFDILSNSGSEQYVIQKSILKKDDLNTAWTLDFLIKLSMFLLLLLVAPFVTSFLGKDEITNGLRVASLLLVINALKQPKLILLKRQLNYRLLFKLSFFQKIVSFIAVIFLAYWLKNFWAFVIADLVGATFLLFASYKAIPKLPKFTLINVKAQWLFSKWLLGKNILGYLRSQIDTLFVSKFFNNHLLGNYHMAREVAMLPAHHFLAPALEPLLASFKEVKNDINALQLQFNKALLVLSLVATPICIFLMFYGDLIITVLLGEQWQKAKVLLSILSMLFIYWVYLLLVEAVLTALGKVKILFWLDLLSLFITFIALSIATLSNADIWAIAIVRVVTGVTLTILTLLYLTIVLKARVFKTCRTFLWPIIPALTSIFVVNKAELSFDISLLTLIVNGGFYSILILCIYIIFIFLSRQAPEHQFILKLMRFKSYT